MTPASRLSASPSFVIVLAHRGGSEYTPERGCCESQGPFTPLRRRVCHRKVAEWGTSARSSLGNVLKRIAHPHPWLNEVQPGSFPGFSKHVSLSVLPLVVFSSWRQGAWRKCELARILLKSHRDDHDQGLTAIVEILGFGLVVSRNKHTRDLKPHYL